MEELPKLEELSDEDLKHAIIRQLHYSALDFHDVIGNNDDKINIMYVRLRIEHIDCLVKEFEKRFGKMREFNYIISSTESKKEIEKSLTMLLGPPCDCNENTCELQGENN